MDYEASGFADTLAKPARRSPEQQMREDLRHFKQLMEAGTERRVTKSVVEIRRDPEKVIPSEPDPGLPGYFGER